MSRILNLARAPFVNSRPVVRAALALWLFGGGLLAANVVLFAGYRSSTAGKQADLEFTRERIAAEQKKIGDLAAQLDRSRVPQLAQQVQFLNARIAERTFDWGLLFDRLAGVLPWNVRIGSLSPVTVQAEKRAGGRGATAPELTPERFRLHIAGAAQDDEALLAFVDALFQHASFQGPDLQRETRQGELAFDLAVTYLPGAEPPATAAATPAGATAATGANDARAEVP